MRETRIAGTHGAASVDDQTIVDFLNQQYFRLRRFTSHVPSVIPTHDYPTEMHVYANASSWSRCEASVQHMNNGAAADERVAVLAPCQVAAHSPEPRNNCPKGVIPSCHPKLPPLPLRRGLHRGAFPHVLILTHRDRQ